jgi:hypothetical protein
VPFDVAFTLDAAERLAFVVALGELDGGTYDFAARRWEER